MDKTDAPEAIKYSQKEGMWPTEVHDDRIKLLAENSPSYLTAKKLAAEFKRSWDSIESDPRFGRRKITDEQIDVIHHMISDDRRITVQQIA